MKIPSGMEELLNHFLREAGINDEVFVTLGANVKGRPQFQNRVYVQKNNPAAKQVELCAQSGSNDTCYMLVASMPSGADFDEFLEKLRFGDEALMLEKYRSRYKWLLVRLATMLSKDNLKEFTVDDLTEEMIWSLNGERREEWTLEKVIESIGLCVSHGYALDYDPETRRYSWKDDFEYRDLSAEQRVTVNTGSANDRRLDEGETLLAEEERIKARLTNLSVNVIPVKKTLDEIIMSDLSSEENINELVGQCEQLQKQIDQLKNKQKEIRDKRARVEGEYTALQKKQREHEQQLDKIGRRIEEFDQAEKARRAEERIVSALVESFAGSSNDAITAALKSLGLPEEKIALLLEKITA